MEPLNKFTYTVLINKILTMKPKKLYELHQNLARQAYNERLDYNSVAYSLAATYRAQKQLKLTSRLTPKASAKNDIYYTVNRIPIYTETSITDMEVYKDIFLLEERISLQVYTVKDLIALNEFLIKLGNKPSNLSINPSIPGVYGQSTLCKNRIARQIICNLCQNKPILEYFSKSTNAEMTEEYMYDLEQVYIATKQIKESQNAE